MSDDNKNSDPFDLDFDALNADEPQNSSGESSFELDDPFGDNLDSSSDMSASVFDDSPETSDSATSDFIGDRLEDESDETGESAPTDLEESDKKKKGKGGWFSKGKDKPGKEKKETPKKEPKSKKEKIEKEKTPPGEKVPRDWGTVLCLAFSAFLLASLLMVNIAGFLTSGERLMQTLCFLGAFNVVGLVAAAVPILFYRFPKERTLPNVMLGIAVIAMFSTLLVAVTELYSYGFIMTP